MLTLLGVAFFCMLTTLGSPDKLLLAEDSKIKIPLTDMSVPFLGFIVVAPLLLIVLFIYLHVFYGYWLECERERQYINKRLIPPIESIPTLFSFPDAVPRKLTVFVFYWLVPIVLLVIVMKALALPEMGLPLMYVTGFVVCVAWVLVVRRRPAPQDPGKTFVGDYSVLAVFIVFTVATPFHPTMSHRPLILFRTDLAQAWLPRTNMRNADARLANFQGANLVLADLRGAILRGANFQGADLRGADLQGADIQRANLQKTKLMGAKNLTQDQVNTACVDENTQLPEGLIRPAPCPAEP
jgi:hypothetical protein